jgi:hypothetical protein
MPETICGFPAARAGLGTRPAHLIVPHSNALAEKTLAKAAHFASVGLAILRAGRTSAKAYQEAA